MALSPSSIARAGSFDHETTEGARCRVTLSRAPELRFEAYGGERDSGARLTYTMPIGGDRTKGAADECRELGRQGSRRDHIRYLIELWEQGLATAEDVEREARKVGIPLTLNGDNGGDGMTGIVK